MTTAIQCPPPERLRALLAHNLAETEQYEIVSHLDDCPGCGRELERLAAGGVEIGVLAKTADEEKPGETSAYWPALQKIEQELKSTPAPGGPSTPTGSEKTTDTSKRELKLDFLDPPERPESIGTLDRFHILNVVGRGGMGVVFRAMDGCLERVVAIKMLDPLYAKNDLAHDRFCREARSAAKIMHENVVTIHHVDENEAKELPYIVMQYVSGESLQERLDTSRRMDLYDIVRIGRQIAAGLGAAHAQNLIHRDVKPANILIEQRTNRVLLTDFGLARMNEDSKLTQTGFVAGTPLFMSPEQARGEPVDYRTDLFSLGGVLYAMCTGSPPFEGSTPFLVLRSVTELQPKPIQEINPEVPDWLVDIIGRLLAKDPGKRFGSADEVAELLDGHLITIPRRAYQTTPRTRTGLLPRLNRSLWSRRLGYVGLGALSLFGLLMVTEGAKATRFTLIGQRGQSRGTGNLFGPDEKLETPRVSFGDKMGVIWSVAYSPKGDMVAMGLEDGTIRLGDPNTGKSLGALKRSDQVGPVWGIAFDAAGTQLASCNDDGHLTIWRLADRSAGPYTRVVAGVRSLAFHPDGNRIATGNRDGTVEIFDMKKGEILSSTMSHAGTVTAVAFSPAGDYLASAGVDKVIKTWVIKPRSAVEQDTLKGHEGSIYALAFDPQGKTLASGGWDSEIHTWDVLTGKKIKNFKAHRSDIWGLAYDPQGKNLISVGADRFVKFWDPTTYAERSSFRAHTGSIYAVAVAGDGSGFITGSRDGTAQVWDLPK